MLSVVGSGLSSANFTRCLGFRFRRGADRFELLLGDDPFRDQLALEELNRIVITFVDINFFGWPVPALVFRVRNGMAVISVGVELKNRRTRFVARAFDGAVRKGADFVKVFAVALSPIDTKSLATFGEAGFND